MYHCQRQWNEWSISSPKFDQISIQFGIIIKAKITLLSNSSSLGEISDSTKINILPKCLLKEKSLLTFRVCFYWNITRKDWENIIFDKFYKSDFFEISVDINLTSYFSYLLHISILHLKILGIKIWTCLGHQILSRYKLFSDFLYF